MHYRRLGKTGLKVSTLCLGTMQFGWSADQSTSFAVMDAAVAAGCNFFDTADIYSSWAEESHPGKSETIIGEWLSQSGLRRGDIILATKVRGKMGDQPTQQGLSRHHILDEVARSLERLQTDYIDLYQVHFPDEETPLEETLTALNDLVRQGMVRYIGCSNFPAWLLTKSLWISDRLHLARFDTLQPHYNLVHRAEFERELWPLCQDQQIGVIPYSPLAGGFLTGKYREGQSLPDSKRAQSIIKRYGNERGFALIQRLDELAQQTGHSIAQLSLAWLLSRETISSVIVGANSVSQLSETLPAVEIQLEPEALDQLNLLSHWQD
ncbi:MAG: aldo/keto reductase [Ardenticatenaceae bacterium]|nr:aldo/keto reductase [Ardenticatenaceae bacterium]